MASAVMVLLCSGVAKTQNLSSRTISLDSVSTDTSYYLADWVVETSIQVRIENQSLSNEFWTFEPTTGLIKFTKLPSNIKEPVQAVITFKEYPITLKRIYNDRAIQPFDSSLLDPDQLNDDIQNQTNRSQNLSGSELDQRGSLSRGIIVGTNQDFALESGLNFELSGKLTDDVSINAVLTDRSIPIQPDGTTQNLKEFDRVFIQVEAPRTTIEMGDVDVSFEKSTFAKLNRRLQGAAGYNSTEYTNLGAAASVVRGVFKSVRFEGLEGVQGPYRLTGNENEEFVIILAGTERVFINGQQVQRGEEQEYIIDYGLGEIYFTNNLLIKDETRIVVEYEYIDQNFNRTLVAAEGEGKFLDERLRIGATVIRQADGNNLLSQRTLTEADIDVLRQAGDDLSTAVVSGAERINPDDEDVNVLYVQKDTTQNGQTFTIFENIPGDPNAEFRVRFSNVGEGQGSYRRAGNSVNGLVFEWVGPNQGSYEPFRTLPAPIEQQMASLNGSFSINKNARIFGEWAVSDFDQNRFSVLDDGDNVDQAYLGGIEIADLQAGLGSLNLKAERRFSGSDFRFFERTRDVEFDRKWNLNNFDQSREITNEIVAGYQFNEITSLGGEFGTIEREGFSGLRQSAQFETQNQQNISVRYQQDFVKSEDEALQIDGNWFRQNGNISKEFLLSGENRIIPYAYFEQENRELRDQNTDSLTNQSLRFYEVAPGIRYETSTWSVDYSIGYRKEDRVLANSLQNESSAIQHTLLFDVAPGSFFNTKNKISIRDKEFTDAFQSQGNTNKRSLLIRSNTSYELSSRAWDGSLLYEVNTQRQALLQETYIEVGPEIGQFVWDDLNGDGVEQLDEFFPELTPNEGTYIRQFIPSDDLLPVVNLKVRFQNEFQPFAFFEEEGLTGFFRQWIFGSRFDISENSTTSDLSDIYFLNLSSFRDSANTIQGRFAFEKSLDMLPDFDKADVFIRYNQQRSLNQRSSELQRIFIDALSVNTRYDITQVIDGETRFINSRNRSESNSIANRNFDIYSNTIEQGFSGTISRSWRTGINLVYASKEDENDAQNPVTAQIVKVRNTNRFFLWRKIQSNSSLEVRNITLKGTGNAVSEFELTEGSGEGVSLQWSLNSSYRVSNLIRLNLIYDGRTVEKRPAIHTARLSVKAIF